MSIRRLPPDEMKPIRDEVLRRDSYACQKCSRSVDLEVHHIKALVDKGTNDLDNLITLCTGCHQEWTFVECVANLEFERWLDIPPYSYLLKFYLSDFKMPHKEARYECERMFLQDKTDRETDESFGRPPRPKNRKRVEKWIKQQVEVVYTHWLSRLEPGEDLETKCIGRVMEMLHQYRGEEEDTEMYRVIVKEQVQRLITSPINL